ncbi:hypothetical protein [Bacillus sp. TH30]|uniref:hypothetical protein n=1 Tax=Bacillus sp. TH30 TaxID=2796395 RepID=UPI001F5BD7CC|nr:hypothetical protein [Bacillus sp. TH30]
MFLSIFCFYLYLRKIKRERKLTGFELEMFIITQVGYILLVLYFIYIDFARCVLRIKTKRILKRS